MDTIVLIRAKELFGEKRFEEIMGELWLQKDKILNRAILKAWPEDPAGALDAVLREWENRFRRDHEEGRHRVGRNRRQRVTRFSEISCDDRNGAEEEVAPEDQLFTRIRRKF